MAADVQEYETQITVWFQADNAEDAVATADRMSDRLRDLPPGVRVACVVTRPIGEHT